MRAIKDVIKLLHSTAAKQYHEGTETAAGEAKESPAVQAAEAKAGVEHMCPDCGMQMECAQCGPKGNSHQRK